MPKQSGVHEFAIVRLDRPERGVKGSEMEPDNKRRMRYYVRGTDQADVFGKMAERFPGEAFYVADVVYNVPPFPWELDGAPTPKQATKQPAETLVAA